MLSGKYSSADLEGEISGDGDGTRKNLQRSLGILTERNFRITDEVKAVAAELGRTASQVALAWLLHQPGVTAPIVGARTRSHLEDNLGCLGLELSTDQLERLDAVSRIELGFPHDFMRTESYKSVIDGKNDIEGTFEVRSRR